MAEIKLRVLSTLSTLSSIVLQPQPLPYLFKFLGFVLGIQINYLDLARENWKQLIVGLQPPTGYRLLS